MKVERIDLKNKMVEPLKILVHSLLEELEIDEKEIEELEQINEHYLKRFDEVSDELEISKKIIKEKEKEIEEMKDIVYDKIEKDYSLINEQIKARKRND